MADTVSVKSPRDETKPRRRWGRWLVLLILIVAVAAALYGFFGRGGGATGQRTLVERVERGTFVRDISGTGTVEAAQTRTLTFGTVAGGAGTVAELNVAEGDEVQAGAVLARLDTASLERDLASAQANLQSARAEAQRVAAQQEADRLDTSSGAASAEDTLTNAQQTLRNAQQKLATTERLAQTGAVSNNEVQADRDAVAQAERAVSQAQIALQAAQSRQGNFDQLASAQRASSQANVASLETSVANLQAQLDEAQLVAPFAGTVSRIDFDAGDQVTAGQGGVQMVDTSSLLVEARFDENRALELRAGQAATIAPDADPESRIPADVRRVNPVASRDEVAGQTTGQGAAQVVTILDFKGETRDLLARGLIRPGYTVTARVDVNRIEDALLIPLEAISEDEGERYVYKVNQSEEGQGTAQRVTLDVLDSNATVAAAQSDNLSADDLIALTNLEDIQDDAAVQYDPLEETP